MEDNFILYKIFYCGFEVSLIYSPLYIVQRYTPIVVVVIFSFQVSFDNFLCSMNYLILEMKPFVRFAYFNYALEIKPLLFVEVFGAHICRSLPITCICVPPLLFDLAVWMLYEM